MDTTPEIKDMLGQRVDIGDTIAVGFRHGNTGALRVGQIIDFGSKKRSCGRVDTIKVDWGVFVKKYSNPDISQIEADNGRFLKVIVPLDTKA